jgi:hypothetical protein
LRADFYWIEFLWVLVFFVAMKKYARTDAGRLGWIGHKEHKKVKN